MRCFRLLIAVIGRTGMTLMQVTVCLLYSSSAILMASRRTLTVDEMLQALDSSDSGDWNVSDVSNCVFAL